MASRQLSTALIVVLFCVLAAFTRAESASVDVKTGDAWFGIYVEGVKQGSLHITVDKKKGATGEYYSIVGRESRAFKVKDKDVTENYDYKASVGLDLKPLSYEAIETKGTTKNTIKAKVTAGVAEITVQFGTAAANPPRKANLTEGDCWSFCAPLLFASRKYATDKPRRYGKIVEVGCAVISFNVAGSAKKVAFQGADTAATEWVETESQKFTLEQGEDGSALWWSETTKAKVTTKYISEPEEVAKSPFDFDGFQKQPKKEVKKGEGDKKGTRFENAYKPVGSEDGDAESARCMMSKAKGWSMRMPEGWDTSFRMTMFGGETLQGDIIKPPHVVEDGWFEILVSYSDKKEKETPTSVLEDFIGRRKNLEVQGEIEKIKLDDKTTIAGAMVQIKDSDEPFDFYIMAACSDNSAFVITPYSIPLFQPAKATWEKYEKEIYAMMGSFRIIDTE
ncbi:MAG: hypothetical protein WC712_04160 [Candidatus Brocadiia bacterium]